MIRTWKSTDAAFSALNTQPDNMLNHKEFVDGLTKAGCCKPKRPAPRLLARPRPRGTTSSARLMPSPRSEDEEDATQLETLSSVFRYLDTSHDGDISRKEFETLERVWRELHQSIYELLGRDLVGRPVRGGWRKLETLTSWTTATLLVVE
ncbi:unnamed protein product [Durusdinium trenchii]|uniref:EF-hand domain-containing protein n=1 Tax=Durusdinium trenchii TaxID=1381693 RepID=A0ABP0HLA3_9DINO